VCDSSVSLEGFDVEILFRTPMKDGCRRLDLDAVLDLVAWIRRDASTLHSMGYTKLVWRARASLPLCMDAQGHRISELVRNYRSTPLITDVRDWTCLLFPTWLLR
jgi:hypothetical protein